MMFVGGIRGYWVGIGIGGVAAVAYAFLSGLITYNSSRIAIWLDPLNDAFKTGTGYQTRQSLIAIGSGGLLGLGLGKSRQKYLYPARGAQRLHLLHHLRGAGPDRRDRLIMAIFALLIIRGYWIALHARDRFGSLLVAGITTQIALQVFLNIARRDESCARTPASRCRSSASAARRSPSSSRRWAWC